MLCRDLIEFIQKNKLEGCPINFNGGTDVGGCLDYITAEIVMYDKNDINITVLVTLYEYDKKDLGLPTYIVRMCRRNCFIGHISLSVANRFKSGENIPDITKAIKIIDDRENNVIDFFQSHDAMRNLWIESNILSEPERYVLTNEVL